MKSQKQRVFLVARKREVPIHVVYWLLEDGNYVPTYRQSPLKKISLYINKNGEESIQMIHNDMRIKRDITEKQANELVEMINRLY